MPGMRKEIPQEETYTKYGGAAGKLESGRLKTWAVCENTFFSEIPGGVVN